MIDDKIKNTILSFFENKKTGYFVDIGAHNGISLSNTFFLEKLGWEGICIEPHPKVFDELTSNRDCEKINCAVWKEDTTVKFLSLSGYTEMLSGIYESYDPRHLKRVQDEITHYGGDSEIIDIPAFKFETVIKKREIDFLSIDTEGSELQILEEINFDLFDIKLICVENNFFETEIIDFFDSKGYKLYDKIFIDYFFCKKIN